MTTRQLRLTLIAIWTVTVVLVVAVVVWGTRADAQTAPDPQDPGPYAVAYDTFTLPDTARADRSVKFHVWRPTTASSAAPRATLDLGLVQLPTASAAGGPTAPGTFPLVIASHGWRALGEQSYRQAEAIASHGYFVVWVTHKGSDITASVGGTLTGFGPGGFGQDFTDRRWDLDFAKRFALFAYNGHITYEAPGDPLLAVMGHSFGGFMAATMQWGTSQPALGFSYPGDPDVDAVVATAPYLGLAPAPIAVVAPLLIIGGKADTTAPPAMSQRLWDSTLSLRKFRLELDGLVHAGPSEVCDFHDAIAVALWNDPTSTLLAQVLTSVHETAGGACDPGGLDRDAIRRTVVGYIVPFLDTQLKGDPDAQTWLARDRSNVAARVLPGDYWRCTPSIGACDLSPS